MYPIRRGLMCRHKRTPRIGKLPIRALTTIGLNCSDRHLCQCAPWQRSALIIQKVYHRYKAGGQTDEPTFEDEDAIIGYIRERTANQTQNV
jgi:hypothetical protein